MDAIKAAADVKIKTAEDAKKVTVKDGQSRTDFTDAKQPGLVLRVSSSGRKTWTVAYWSRQGAGAMRRMTVGEFPAMSLAKARDKARSIIGQAAKGEDPQAAKVEKRKAAKAEAEQAPARTFAAVVEDYYQRYQIGEAGNTSAKQARDTMLTKCKVWHRRAVDTITAPQIGKLLEGIRDSGHGYGANMLYRHLRHFFGWCARPDVGYIDTSPMAKMSPPFKDTKPRDRFYTPEEIGALWRAASRLTVYESAYLRALLMTGKRKTALSAMRHGEIGPDGWWRPTDAKDKGKKLHMPIPLPGPALKIVRALPKIEGNDFIFPGRNKGSHLSPTGPLQRKIKAASGVEDFGFHAVRHSLVTHLTDLRVPGNAARRFTDHAQISDAHERHYSHSELEIVTEQAAETWGRFVKLAARPLVYRAVRAYLDCEDVPEGEERREERGRRNFDYCQAIQRGGKEWITWVRGVARPAREGTKVVPFRAR